MDWKNCAGDRCCESSQNDRNHCNYCPGDGLKSSLKSRLCCCKSPLKVFESLGSAISPPKLPTSSRLLASILS